MALDVDGFSVLQAITARPDAFPDIRAEAAKSARALVAKQLKAKGLALSGLRGVRDSLGAEPFALIVDGMTDGEAKSLVTRLDKHHPDLKAAAADWPRRHVVALAAGAEPTGKPIASGAATPIPASAKPPKAPKVTRALGSAAFAASWDGRDHDPKAAKVKKKKGG